MEEAQEILELQNSGTGERIKHAFHVLSKAVFFDSGRARIQG